MQLRSLAMQSRMKIIGRHVTAMRRRRLPVLLNLLIGRFPIILMMKCFGKEID